MGSASGALPMFGCTRSAAGHCSTRLRQGIAADIVPAPVRFTPLPVAALQAPAADTTSSAPFVTRRCTTGKIYLARQTAQPLAKGAGDNPDTWLGSGPASAILAEPVLGSSDELIPDLGRAQYLNSLHVAPPDTATRSDIQCIEFGGGRLICGYVTSVNAPLPQFPRSSVLQVGIRQGLISSLVYRHDQQSVALMWATPSAFRFQLQPPKRPLYKLDRLPTSRFGAAEKICLLHCPYKLLWRGLFSAQFSSRYRWILPPH